MTSPYYMERGIERRIARECRDCVHISKAVPTLRDDIGICENFESDHFGHVIYIYHPACKQFEEAA